MAAPACNSPDQSRRRHFWTTQPNPCGNYKSCGDDCGVPGLSLQPPIGCAECRCKCKGPIHDPECLASDRAQRPRTGLTFATNDWVRSLMLNIFNTYARKAASKCGDRPGTQGGHWSESYGDGTYVGTTMYSTVAPVKSFKDAIKLLAAAVAKDAYKLVTYGVAASVATDVEYIGNNRVRVTVDVTGPYFGGQGRVNLIAERLDNDWVWSA